MSNDIVVWSVSVFMLIVIIWQSVAYIFADYLSLRGANAREGMCGVIEGLTDASGNDMAAFDALYDQVQDLSGNVTTLQGQVKGLISSQQQYTQQMVGTTPPTITGATS